MATTRALVSLCIPAYQAERHLAATLRSAIAQAYEPLEIVVLDNASTDRTADILAAVDDPRVRVERNVEVLPLSQNWNRLISLSKGELVKLLCADDLIHPEAVAQQAQILTDDPGVALVASRRHFVDDEGRVLATSRGLNRLVGRNRGGAVATRVVRNGGNPIGEPGGVMFRREDFDAVGGFDATLPFPMDLELWMRLLKRGAMVGVPDSLAAFRARPGSVSGSHSHPLYVEQRALTRRIAADPDWDIGRVSRVVGRAGAVRARIQRKALFAVAARPRLWTPSRMNGDAGWLQ